MEDQGLLTVQQVASMLQMKPRKVREAITKGDLRAIRVGEGERGELRIERNDLKVWLKSRETKPQDLALAG